MNRIEITETITMAPPPGEGFQLTSHDRVPGFSVQIWSRCSDRPDSFEVVAEDVYPYAGDWRKTFDMTAEGGIIPGPTMYVLDRHQPLLDQWIEALRHTYASLSDDTPRSEPW
jgi:hypothetical protein